MKDGRSSTSETGSLYTLFLPLTMDGTLGKGLIFPVLLMEAEALLTTRTRARKGGTDFAQPWATLLCPSPLSPGFHRRQQHHVATDQSVTHTHVCLQETNRELLKLSLHRHSVWKLHKLPRHPNTRREALGQCFHTGDPREDGKCILGMDPNNIPGLHEPRLQRLIQEGLLRFS